MPGMPELKLAAEQVYFTVQMSSEETMNVRQPNTKWLDKEFLETALRSWLKDPEVSVTGFTFTMATSKGDNYGSDMFRVIVKLEQKKDPLSIIIKRLFHVDIYGEAVLTASTSFTRERRMLSEVLPEMHAVLKNVIPGLEPFGAYFMYATASELVMEDLQQGGFQMAQRRLGLDLNHCSLVLRTLARYHAASVLLMEHKSMDFSVFEKCLFSEAQDTVGNFINGMVRTLSEEVKNIEHLAKYSPKLAALADKNFLTFICELLDNHEEDDFLVLSHGDLWTNNILFRYTSSGEPDGIRFVDFQLPNFTSPCIDIQYFLNTSSNEKVRTTCSDRLIEEYHETLCTTMAALGCSIRPPTIEKLKEDFHKKSLYGMYAAFAVLPISMSEPGQFDFMDVSQTGKPQSALFRSKYYRRALEWFLPLYENKGFL